MKRKHAQLLNLKKYESEYPCARNHKKLRYTNTGACVECVALYSKREKNKDVIVRFDKGLVPYIQPIIELLGGNMETLRG